MKDKMNFQIEQHLKKQENLKNFVIDTKHKHKQNMLLNKTSKRN